MKSKFCKVLCLGDIILDSYSHGDVRRISPEAPIPVLKINDNKYEVLGGCGNVAKNICAAGSECHIISISGNDEEQKVLSKLLSESKKLTYDLIIDKKRCTTKKVRFVSNNQQILRVDKEMTDYIDETIESKILEKFSRKIDFCNVVVLSDYNKGMLTNTLLKNVIKVSKIKGKTIIVDPKKHDFLAYKGSDIITPNFKELLEASNYDNEKIKPSNKLVINLSKKLMRKFHFKAVITTRSSEGISIIDENKNIHLPSRAREVYDVSGAGDTVLAYIASGLAKGKSLANATEIANDAAGVAVGRFGTTIVSESDLLDSNPINKMCSIEELESDLRKNLNKKIGFTNGCFDLIHQGHIHYLKEARKNCDLLILALNSDNSIKRIKGKDRPILKQEERSEILRNFNFIDRIVIFDEKTPLNLIKKIKPQIIFKGDDYSIKDVVGNKEIKKWGGKISLIKCVKGKSTSKIIGKIKNGT